MASPYTPSLQLRAKAELERRKRQQNPPPKPPAISLLAWQYRHRKLLKPGLSFNLSEHKYLKGLYLDRGIETVVEKSSQSGVSEYAVSFALWSCDERLATVLYIFPTDRGVSDFSTARLGPAIESSPHLSEIVSPAERRGVDRVGLKRIGDRFLYLRGAMVQPDGKSPQIKSVDADVYILDEFDEMDTRVKPLADERLGHSAIAEKRLISTPTFAGVGIHAQYMVSDQRQWFVRCPHCGSRQPLELSDLITEWDELHRPRVWNAVGGQKQAVILGSDGKVDWSKAEAPALHCRNCWLDLDRLGSGEWIATYPARSIHGYHISRLFVAQKPLSEIVDGLMVLDESKRQQIWNQALGLPYQSEGAQTLTPELLDKCRREYALGPQRGGSFCGIDVGRVLNVVIRGPDWSLRYAGQLRDFDEVEPLLTDYGVLACVVDANPETRLARLFQAKYPPGYVWLAYYVPGREDKTLLPFDWDTERWVVNADRTRTLDSTMSMFRLGAKNENGTTLPANARDIPDYYAQLCAPERRIEHDSKGNSRAVYVEKGPDHYAHAENYAYLAAVYWLYAAEHQSEVVYSPVRIGAY